MRLMAGVVLCAGLLGSVAMGEPRSPLGESLKDVDVAEHWIYDDWPQAVAEAKATGKPLLVVLRCVPCPPGRALDTAVMQPESKLAAVEKQFVCVRLIQANGLDLDLFQYDFDMSWAAMFLNADGTVYGRYGSRDASGPASDRLLSATAFQKAAERALALHKSYPGNKEQLASKRGPKPTYASPTEIPGLTERPTDATMRQNCIHCHMVKEFALRAKWEAGQLSTKDLYVFPQPTNLGLTMEVDDGLVVQSVVEGSPADAAGLATGDQIASINGQPLVSLADIQWALHVAQDDKPISIDVLRGIRSLSKTVKPGADWKKSDIAWRASSWYGLRQGFKTEALTEADKAAHGIAADRLALVVKNLFGNSAMALPQAGVKKDDIIVAVDGQTQDMTESEFLVNLRLNHGPRDSVVFTILRGGERHEVKVPMW